MRGTVLFGSGGAGTEFYTDVAGGAAMLADLRVRGFRVIDRRWRTGWFTTGSSIKRQSGRYAALLAWVRQNLHTTGAFCASGNSGGAAEIAYALTTWGGGALLDVAVLSGGPPMTRLDYLCQSPSSQWSQLCSTLVPQYVMTCGQPQCGPPPGCPVCPYLPPSPAPLQLHEDSILHPAAVLGYPGTRVHCLLGTDDCTNAVPLGAMFFAAVTSTKVVEYVPGAPHLMSATLEGREAITRAILGGAACPGVTLSARAWPSIGGQLELDARGPAGQAYQVFLGSTATMFEIPGLGWLFIGPALVPVGNGILDPVTGAATLSIPVPMQPALVGTRLLDQAIAGACLTNLLQVGIL